MNAKRGNNNIPKARKVHLLELSTKLHASSKMMDYFFPLPTEKDEDSVAAEMITQAMINTKSYVEIFRDDAASRTPAMEFFFRRNLKMIKTKTPECIHYHYNEDKTSLDCFFMLVPSFGAHFTLYEKIILGGILEFALRFGWAVTSRMIRLSDFVDAIEIDLMKGRQYYSLQRMAVSPALQGKGVGSKYLGEALKEADRNQLPVVLGTQDARNVTFYSRL